MRNTTSVTAPELDSGSITCPLDALPPTPAGWVGELQKSWLIRWAIAIFLLAGFIPQSTVFAQQTGASNSSSSIGYTMQRLKYTIFDSTQDVSLLNPLVLWRNRTEDRGEVHYAIQFDNDGASSVTMTYEPTTWETESLGAPLQSVRTTLAQVTAINSAGDTMYTIPATGVDSSLLLGWQSPLRLLSAFGDVTPELLTYAADRQDATLTTSENGYVLTEATMEDSILIEYVYEVDRNTLTTTTRTIVDGKQTQQEISAFSKSIGEDLDTLLYPLITFQMKATPAGSPAGVRYQVLLYSAHTHGLTDAAAKQGISATAGAESESIGSQLKVRAFPSPTQDYLHLELLGDFRPDQPIRVTVFDAAGRQVLLRDDYEIGTALDVANLAPGIHFLRARLEGTDYISTFTKQ